jgi:S-adenosylmethionine-diacylgycerolhomoserine-N-methlytransferase
MSVQTNIDDKNKALQQYYKLHSRIYDSTRWSFLFGRKTIVEQLATRTNARRILEVGCGTGKNLALIANRFPTAQIVGVDVSLNMLNVAKRKLIHLTNRVTLLNQPYPLSPPNGQKYDQILFAYALSMFNPGWETAITSALGDLNEGGTLAVVDFHRTSVTTFARWMGANHVRMEGHLLPFLESHTNNPSYEVRKAYGGLWEYVIFTGEKRSEQPG